MTSWGHSNKEVIFSRAAIRALLKLMKNERRQATRSNLEIQKREPIRQSLISQQVLLATKGYYIFTITRYISVHVRYSASTAIRMRTTLRPNPTIRTYVKIYENWWNILGVRHAAIPSRHGIRNRHSQDSLYGEALQARVRPLKETSTRSSNQT